MHERVTVVCLSFILSVCLSITLSNADLEDGRLLILKAEELRLDHYLSHFNLPLFLNFGPVFEKMRETYAMVSDAI